MKRSIDKCRKTEGRLFPPHLSPQKHNKQALRFKKISNKKIKQEKMLEQKRFYKNKSSLSYFSPMVEYACGVYPLKKKLKHKAPLEEGPIKFPPLPEETIVSGKKTSEFFSKSFGPLSKKILKVLEKVKDSFREIGEFLFSPIGKNIKDRNMTGKGKVKHKKLEEAQ